MARFIMLSRLETFTGFKMIDQVLIIYSAAQLNLPPLFFSVFITILFLFINLLYIARKLRTRCIFWYIYVEHQMQFKM
jgi:hypothetical protein